MEPQGSEGVRRGKGKGSGVMEGGGEGVTVRASGGRARGEAL